MCKDKKKSEFDELSISYLKDQLTPDGEIEPANKKNGGSNSQSRDGLPPNMRFSRYTYLIIPRLYPKIISIVQKFPYKLHIYDNVFFCSIYRAASYNNPHEMFPSASKLFSGMTAAAGNVTKLNMAKSSTSMTVVNEGEEGNINLQTWKNSIILPTTFYYYGLFPKEIRQENDLAKICILHCASI